MNQTSITPSEIIQYLFCLRFIYFEHVLGIPQHEEKSNKAMRGRHLHEDKKRMNKDYLRTKSGVTENSRNSISPTTCSGARLMKFSCLKMELPLRSTINLHNIKEEQTNNSQALS